MVNWKDDKKYNVNIHLRQPKEAETLLSVSHNHLERVGVLQGTEWKMAFTLWAAILLITSTSVINLDKLWPLFSSIYGVLLLGFSFTAWAYLFKFCQSNYVSLVTERNRYQYFQNRALANLKSFNKESDLISTGSEDAEPSVEKVSNCEFKDSSVWKFKVVSTSAMLIASWCTIVFSSFYYKAHNVDNITLSEFNIVKTLLCCDVVQGLSLLAGVIVFIAFLTTGFGNPNSSKENNGLNV